jgi:DNA-binding CsgD family transcriptional regulator
VAKAIIKAELDRRERAGYSPIGSSTGAKRRQLVRSTGNTLKQLRKAIDPREVAGGLAGLTAGQFVGGVLGGAAGTVIAGPAGSAVGAQLGSFTAAMLGLKLGADFVHDRLEMNRARKTLEPKITASNTPKRTSIKRFLQIRTGERLGEIVGLTTGASIGLVIAGPAGGLTGAVIGEALGGHVSGDLSKSRFNKESRVKPNENVGQWLDRFGKNTVGEAVSVLVAGSVGSLFGPGGRLVGHRVGLIVGKRVEWHKLNEGEHQELPQPLALLPPQEVIPGPDESVVQPDQVKFVVGQQEPLMLTAGIEGQTSSVKPDPPVQFTRRQLEVLILLSSQLDTEEIAEQLGITQATVKYHKRNIYEKLRTNSYDEATYVAVELEPGLDDLS